MKRLLLVFVALSLIAATAISQEKYTKPTLVQKAVYFDKTPPLRDMPVILPGQRDRSWKDGVIQNESFEGEIREMVRNNPFNGPDAAVQSSRSSRSVMGPLVSMDGTGNVNGVYPPDTDGDVGPNHYFQMINLSFAIYDKNGTKLYGPVDNSTLWSGFPGPWSGTNDGDPVVLYDELADRWIATQFAVNTSNGTYWELVAVSQTPDPLGEWYRYAFQFFAFNDYPKLAVWPDAYYMTFNMFGSYTRVGVAALERDEMLAGNPNARMVYYDLSASTFGMLPSDFDGTPPPAGTPAYFAHLRTFDNHNLEIYEFDVDWNNTGNSSFTLVNTLTPATFSSSLNGIPQPGTSQKLDDLAVFLMYRLQYRNFGSHQTLVLNHTVNNSGRAGVRWYELRKTGSNWTIYQQGTYSPDITHRWMGSIAMNGNGDIALGFSASSSTVYPSVRYTGRRAEDPLGQMTVQEVEVITGLSSQTFLNRWGDYACMSVDPVDDSTFWFTQEYMKASNWGTRIVSFNLSPLAPPTVNAGADTAICENMLYPANGIVTSAQSVLWTTAGDGFFQNPNNISTLYLRGPQDIVNGTVMLTLTAQGYEPGFVASDSVLVTVNKLPSAFAGNDTLLCIGEVLWLDQASAISYDSLLWTTSGDGSFDDATLLNAVYTPGSTDIAAGTVDLTLTASGKTPCAESDASTITVTIEECTGIGEVSLTSPEMTIIPNPNTGTFNVIMNGSGNMTLQVYDLSGQNLFTHRLSSLKENHSKRIDMSAFPKGIYFITLSNEDAHQTRKLVIY
ncbi:MAG: T9SS type A sorting domain-containing protein [Bacteroidetes bacterium]|nr:T9SS type A sorting domain-containing protein [Bacteroidota bacterium]